MNASPSAFQHDVIVALSQSYERETERQRALTALLARNNDKDTRADTALRDKVRITLAASLLSERQSHQARELLGDIDLASPSAVTAALLLAEAARLEGSDDAAVQWFLRIAQQHPQDLQALSGLLSAALTLRDSGEPGKAATLLSRVEADANNAALSLQTLAQQHPASIASLMKASDTLNSSLRDQASKRLFATSRSEVSRADRANRRSREITACLAAVISDYQSRLTRAEAGLTNLDDTLDALAERIDQRTQRITQLSQQVRANDLGAEQTQIRKGLRALMNENLRDKAQYQALVQNREKLPVLVNATRQRLSALLEYYQGIEANSGDVVARAINEALMSLAADFRNLAGEAALQRAELRQRRLEQVQTKP